MSDVCVEEKGGGGGTESEREDKTHGYTQTVAWKPIVKAPWKMNSIAAAAAPAACLDGVENWTWRTRPAWAAITAAMREIIERN